MEGLRDSPASSTADKDGFSSPRLSGLHGSLASCTADKDRMNGLLLSGYAYNCNGEFVESADHDIESDSDEVTLRWDESGLQLIHKHSEHSEPTFTLKWTSIAGIWAEVRQRRIRQQRRQKNNTLFILEATITTGKKWYCDKAGNDDGVEAVHFLAVMNDACGQFLDYLDVHQASIVKQGRPPSWLVSRHWTPVYSQGVSSHRIRVIKDWASIIVESLFAIAFLAAFRTIATKNGERLFRQLDELVHDQSYLQYLADLMMVAVYMRGLWSTLIALLRTFSSIRALISKTQKSTKTMLTNRKIHYTDSERKKQKVR